MAASKPVRFLLLFCLLLCMLAVAAWAAEDGPAFAFALPLEEDRSVTIAPQRVGGETYLFLPAAAQLDALTLRFDGEEAQLVGDAGSLSLTSGEPFSLLDLCAGGQDAYALTFVSGETSQPFRLLRSEALRSAFLTSADPEGKGRAYVDADKDRKVKDGAFTLLRADGSVVWSGALKNIKSRGNSTWNYPKKPYQIKLSEKADLLETGEKAEKENTWLLLANYIDPTLLHNQLTFDLAADFGLAYTPHSASVDLYYDGEYRGVYELCEKTEVSKGRVAIHDLEGDVEDANPDAADMDALPRAAAALDSGLTYQYVTGLTAPEDLRGGYLLEMDYPARAEAEPSWFETTHRQHIVVKSPEYMPEEAMRYIAALYERFENAVYAGGVDPESGTDYRDVMDLDSLVRCFLILELAEDNDAFASSTFFYKPADEEKLYAGPVWDFDTGYGTAALPDDCSVAGGTQLGNLLLRIPSFREALQARWQELHQLVDDIVLSDDPDASQALLRSLVGYEAEIASSRTMNLTLWPAKGAADTDLIAALSARLAHRAVWLDARIEAWCTSDVSDWNYADVPERSWFYSSVQYTVSLGLFQGSSAILFEPEAQMSRAMAVTVLHRLAGMPSVETVAAFQDVPGNVWYTDAVSWAKKSGVTTGVDENRFAPTRNVTREQFVTLLYRAACVAGLESASDSEALSSFTDGDTVSAWAVEALSWAVDSGLVQGSSGLLTPRDKLTRAQAAAILARFHQDYPVLCGIQ